MPVLYVVDVKHGNSTILIDTSGIVVIDAGRRSELLEFLIKKKITEIDTLLLSHADADHIGGAMALIDSEYIEVKEIFVNSDSTKETKIFDDLVWSAYNNPKIKFIPSLTPDINGKIDQENVKIEVLAPNNYLVAKGSGGLNRNGKRINSNSISAVIRLKYKDQNIALLPGDIDLVGLDSLLTDKVSLNTWLLVYPHHGGNSGNKDNIEFVKAICEHTKAKTIIFSIENNENEFPLLEVITCIGENLDTSLMYTTGSSGIFSNYISSIPGCKHRNNVGSIEVDFNVYPPTILTEK